MTCLPVTTAALVAMLLHAAFGCCWHHAHGHVGHAGGDNTVAASVSAAPADDGHSHGHGHHHEYGHRHGHRHHGHGTVGVPHVHWDGGPADPGHEHDDCSGDVCRFVTGPPVTPPPSAVVWIGFDAGSARLAGVAGAADDSGRPPAPPGDIGSPTHGLLPRLGRWLV